MSVTKEEVLNFIRRVRIAHDAKIAAKYATISEFGVLQNSVSELSTMELDTSNFVVQENGKGLSTNDFTDADKEKLNNLDADATNSTFSTEDLEFVLN